MKGTPNNDLSKGNLIPLLMYSSFEDYFGCENNLERIELLIKTILKKEGVESVKVLRKLDTRHNEDDGSIGIVDVECVCDSKNINAEVIASYIKTDNYNTFTHACELSSRDVDFSFEDPEYYENLNKTIQIVLSPYKEEYGQYMLRDVEDPDYVYSDTLKIIHINTLYYASRCLDTTSSTLDKVVGVLAITDEDKLKELTKDLEEYKDLVDSVKAYSKSDDIISKYDKYKYLNSIKKYQSSTR